MTRVNTQLQVNPALQHMPKDQREWHHFINEFAKWVVDVDVNGVLTTELPVPQVLLANRGSVQTTTPVTATDAGAAATITIASHVLETANRSVSYSSGSITGLSYSTTYYVYADDPGFSGGAVTYLASTSKSDVTGAIGRYLVGSVLTPAAAAPDTPGNSGGGFASLGETIVISGGSFLGDITISGDFAHTGDEFAAFGGTPVAQPGAYTQTYATADKTHANPTATTLTDSSGGSAGATVAAITPINGSGATTAQETDVNDNFASVTDEINKLIADVADVKQLVNSVIDDLQALNLLQ